jgi:hypothetical protein
MQWSTARAANSVCSLPRKRGRGRTECVAQLSHQAQWNRRQIRYRIRNAVAGCGISERNHRAVNSVCSLPRLRGRGGEGVKNKTGDV